MIHICKFYTGIRQMTPANLLFIHKLSYLTAVFIEIIMDEFGNCFFMEINDDFFS
jgi:acetyl/propionyl-CoA carboxylase alpha subunit